MTNLQVSEDILPLGQFKTHASQLLKSINTNNRTIVITQNGKPAGVVMSPTDRLNSQARFILAVQQGLNDEQAGRVIDDEQLDAVLERELPTAWSYAGANAQLTTLSPLHWLPSSRDCESILFILLFKTIRCAVIGCAEQSEAHRSRMMRLLRSAHPMALSNWFENTYIYMHNTKHGAFYL